MQTLSDLGDTLNQIDIMASRARICQGELLEDYFQFDDAVFIVCCHTEAGAKNDIVGDYLAKIRAEIRALQKAVEQISKGECEK